MRVPCSMVLGPMKRLTLLQPASTRKASRAGVIIGSAGPHTNCNLTDSPRPCILAEQQARMVDQ